jgi:outer membrane biosynthesis protein TonB
LTPASEEKVEKAEMTQNSIKGTHKLTESCINCFPAPPLGFMTSHFQNVAIFLTFEKVKKVKKVKKPTSQKSQKVKKVEKLKKSKKSKKSKMSKKVKKVKKSKKQGPNFQNKSSNDFDKNDSTKPVASGLERWPAAFSLGGIS